MRRWLAGATASWFGRRAPRTEETQTRGAVEPTRFVMLFPGRTGSSYLVSCLAEHPQVHVEGERLVRADADEQRAILDALYGCHRPRAIRAVGFKTKLKDVASLEGFEATLVRRQVRIITLLRRNRVKLAVSTINAKRIHAERGRWNLAAGESLLSPLDASPEEIVAMIARVEGMQREVGAFAARLPLRRLELHYEDLLTAQPATIARVEAFLGIDAVPLVGSVAKATDDDLRRSVLHFDALADRLRGTAYEADLGPA